MNLVLIFFISLLCFAENPHSRWVLGTQINENIRILKNTQQPDWRIIIETVDSIKNVSLQEEVKLMKIILSKMGIHDWNVLSQKNWEVRSQKIKSLSGNYLDLKGKKVFFHQFSIEKNRASFKILSTSSLQTSVENAAFEILKILEER